MKSLILCYLAGVIITSLFLFQDKASAESIQRGSKIYADFCITCHLENGEGVANTFPPLANSDYLRENRIGSIRGVKYGRRGELKVNGVVYNNTMMPLGLEDEEIADVMNFVMNSWGNSQEKAVTPEEVEGIGPR